MKILLLAAYSVTLFLVNSWWGITSCAGLFGAVALASRVPLRRYFALMVPVYVIALFAVVFNGFALNVDQVPAQSLSGLGAVSAGVFAQWEPVLLVGSFGLVPAGFARGCFFAARIILLVVASLVVTYTTTSTGLTNALACFMQPLRKLRVPVDDVATVFSLALRFIPVTAEEFARVHGAQWARGAAFYEGTMWQRLRAWQTVLIPLFVGLFRRADTLALAMDARCYGAPAVKRTSLVVQQLSGQEVAVLVAGLVVCALLSWLL